MNTQSTEHVFLTQQMADDARTEAGGYTKAQVEVLGLTFPPKKGWLRAFIGKPMPLDQWQRFVEAANVRVTKKKNKAAQTSADQTTTPIFPNEPCQPQNATRIQELTDKISKIEQATIDLVRLCDRQDSEIKKDPQLYRAINKLLAAVQPKVTQPS